MSEIAKAFFRRISDARIRDAEFYDHVRAQLDKFHSDAAPTSEHAAAIPSHGTAAGEAATSNEPVASPLSHSEREV